MAKQTGRSLQLSAQGRQKADIALKKFASKRDLAAQLGMSPTTVTNFFAGRTVKRREFHEICKKLRLDWQEVIDLPQKTESEPLEEKQSNSSDIDELVQEVRSRCCDKILHLYSTIQLLNRQQIDVDKLYVDVYVLEKLASESYATIPDLLKGLDLRDGFDRLGLGKREKRSPGFEVATHYPRLMVLGKPGSGKSTFLRHLAVACCKGEFLADRIPILIELRDINACEFNLLNYIHQEFDLADEEQTKQILKQGKVLILLDGLDEVTGQSRREVQDHIYKFSQFQHYYKNRFILTCRTQTLKYISDKFEPVEVADFNLEQVEIFAYNWFTALAETPEQGAELTVKFLGKLRLPENKQTAELAVTPILLSLTCWVFNDLKDLPAKRSDLYEQGINLLLEKWDEKRGVRREVESEVYQTLSVGEKKKLLSYLAARKFEQKQYVLFEQGELQGYIAEYLGISTEDSEAVLDALAAQYGLLIERAQGFWSFSHLTFQEYFTAKWFCDRADWHGLISHIKEKHWREVFLLAAGTAKNIDELLPLMKGQVDAIASNKEIRQFLTWINNKCIAIESPYKPAALRAFCYAFEMEYIYHIDFAFEITHKNLNFDFSDWISVNELLFKNDLPSKYALSVSIDTNMGQEPDTSLDYTFGSSSTRNLESLIEQLKNSHYYLEQSVTSSNNFTVIQAKIEWWKTKGQAWLEKLRTVLSDYRSSGSQWQFSQQQQELLKQYYDANKLLVDCLNSNCRVNDEVRKKIEEKLLLPFDVIENS